MMVDCHTSTLMIIDPQKYQEFTVTDYFNAGVHDDRPHVNGSVTRFASVFSWRYLFLREALAYEKFEPWNYKIEPNTL